jgi:hypothetical protein
VKAELVSNLFDVILSGALGDDEPLGDLAVRESVGDELSHLLFAPAQPCSSHPLAHVAKVSPKSAVCRY